MSNTQFEDVFKARVKHSQEMKPKQLREIDRCAMELLKEDRKYIGSGEDGELHMEYME